MARERVEGKRPGAGDGVPGEVVYEVVITAAEEGEVDDYRVIGALNEWRPQIERVLTDQAVRRFGPGYAVRMTEAWIGGSVHQLVLLSIEKTVRTVAVGIDELRRFVGEIEVTIAQAMDPEGNSLEVFVEMRTAPAEPAPATEDSAPWERIAPILGAVATGIGVLGFVTFVGGATDWARFRATGLPQEQALAVVPTQDLVVVGARTLVPAVVAGLLACVFYAIGRAFFGTAEQRISDTGLRAYVEKHATTIRAVFLLSWFSIFAVAAFLVTLETLGILQFLVFVPLGLILAGLIYAVAEATARFAYLALTLFLALSVFMGGIAYARALATPELRAAAIIRENQKALVGFFVAENGSRVYLARLNGNLLREGIIDRSSARLIGVEKSEITDIEVGAPTSPRKALEEAHTLAEELCELEITPAPDPKRSLADQNCWSALPGRPQSAPSSSPGR